jgi:competence CoiA-like predicted nuclease
MKEILYTVATDLYGTLIKAFDAEKGGSFFCPECKTKLILRKSGKTGNGTKRPHFAHRGLTPNCTPETALHSVFKNLL